MKKKKILEIDFPDNLKVSLKIRKIGNSLGIVIPSDIVKHLEAEEENLIEIDIIRIIKKDYHLLKIDKKDIERVKLLLKSEEKEDSKQNGKKN